MYNLHPYQEKAKEFLLSSPYRALFLDPGLGKTLITLSALMEKPRGKTLIVAPLRVCYNVWPKEIEKWNFPFTYQILHGHKEIHDADIYIINYEGLTWLYKQKLKIDYLVLDELTKVKNSSTIRSKIVRSLKAKTRWGLTGSPVANNYEGLFGQCLALDHGVTFGRYRTRFLDAYYSKPPWRKYGYTIRPGAAEQITERVKHISISMSAEDYIEVGGLQNNTISVQLPKKLTKLYSAMERGFVVQLEQEQFSAANAAVAVGKCKQISNGAIYKPDGQIQHLHTEKVEALRELIDELQGNPLIIMYEYRHDLEAIRTIGDFPLISNTTLDPWNRGEIPVILGHPKSVAHGLNMQDGGYNICWYSIPHSYEEYDQANRRIYRQGQKAPVVHVHHIVTEETVDESILFTLNNSGEEQKSFFKRLAQNREVKNDKC